MPSFLALMLIFLLLPFQQVMAAEQDGFSTNKRFALKLYQSDIRAHEYAYSGSHKNSELIWDTRQATMAGFDLFYPLSVRKKIRLNIGFASIVTDARSVMDDYDWLVAGNPNWSDWSHHDNTALKTGLSFDLNVSSPFYRNGSGDISVEWLVGISREQWKWQAVGGTYIYSVNGFRDQSGRFPDVPGITYQQTVDTPYIGVAAQGRVGDLYLDGRLIFSSLVSAKNVDTHHQRGIIFSEQYTNGKMAGVDLNLLYQLDRGVSLGFYVARKFYQRNRTDAIVNDNGVYYLAPDGGGMSLGQSSYGLKAEYSF